SASSRFSNSSNRSRMRPFWRVRRTCIRIGGLKNWDARTCHRYRPSVPSIRRANGRENRRFLVAAVGIVKEHFNENTHERAVRHDKDLWVLSFVTVTQINNVARQLRT